MIDPRSGSEILSRILDFVVLLMKWEGILGRVAFTKGNDLGLFPGVRVICGRGESEQRLVVKV